MSSICPEANSIYLKGLKAISILTKHQFGQLLSGAIKRCLGLLLEYKKSIRRVIVEVGKTLSTVVGLKWTPAVRTETVTVGVDVKVIGVGLSHW